MRTILCILTANSDAFAHQTLAAEKQLPDIAVEVIDLNVAEPDYEKLLDAVLAADSVQVW